MSQVTGPLTINNGAATPVAKTFSPERIVPELSTFTERSTGVSAGYLRLGVGFSPASKARVTNKVDVTLDFPVLSTVNGVSSVAYVGRFRGTFTMPDTMTAAERADFAAFVANALDITQVRGVIKDLDPLY
ncbi:TPA_asm: coat protein [ssRNA phage Gerhypos.4_50]|uniref:Coat protein n=2 Tax=Fiersviridae TaxID=2842319 RepID=A0A8S5KZM1_9VIRU|nr:coat protein [ssRNA phage Gerhypos.4_50]QDH87265.1 MAG: hypothetical protein H4Bulk46985_000002 [Leviviridae sp.]DAD50298.1 TPA_asm: coat protein [ssRNA phage Gerhypos.4_50]